MLHDVYVEYGLTFVSFVQYDTPENRAAAEAIAENALQVYTSASIVFSFLLSIEFSASTF